MEFLRYAFPVTYQQRLYIVSSSECFKLKFSSLYVQSNVSNSFNQDEVGKIVQLSKERLDS